MSDVDDDTRSGPEQPFDDTALFNDGGSQVADPEPGDGPTGGDPAERPGGVGERTLSRAERRAEWRRTEKARRYAARKSVRFPIFTRSVLLWMLIFALAGLAFGASGAFWWAHFNTQVSQLRQDTTDFEARSQKASGDIDQQRTDALAQIDAALKPLQGFLSETQILQLAETFSPAVYSVATLDPEGAPSVGTGFAVISDDNETYLVTSYTTVKAATSRPGPDVTVRKGADELAAEVWNWDPDKDLALLKIDRGGTEVLEWESDENAAQALGTRIFPISGLGGAGAALTTGQVVDLSSAGFQHTAPLGAAWQGAPIIAVDGKILGIASLNYSPLGFSSGEVHFAPPIGSVCGRLIQCGTVRTPAPRN